METDSGFNTRRMPKATDFELRDYWDEGELLDGRERWPVCVTLNLVPPAHYLDATSPEEAATPLKLLLIFSFPSSSTSMLQGIRMLGPGELDLKITQGLVQEGEKYARELCASLDAKLKEEELRRNQKAYTKFTKTQ
ncbi:hypothetical protein AX14_010771 [Amanita brunnescens Koide BX004]|nr:hypothetical protein AX14_010771 [Amanita brunnescens Koide BX004]